MISIPSTIIFFESPKRIIKTLIELGNVFGSSHNIAICRELTKNFEENKRGSISSIINFLTSENKLKGEFTVIVDKKKIDIVSGSEYNFKITTPEDIEIAEKLFLNV